MKTVIECPLGAKCERAEDNTIIRCAWYQKIVGKDPQSDKDIEEWRCAMSWLPILLVENAQTNRGQTAAIESFRNETVKGQEEFNNLLKIGLHESRNSKYRAIRAE